jgi:hypothetical protein
MELPLWIAACPQDRSVIALPCRPSVDCVFIIIIEETTMARLVLVIVFLAIAACRQLTPAEQAAQAQKAQNTEIYEKCQKPIYTEGRYGMTAFAVIQLQNKVQPRWGLYQKCLKDNRLPESDYALGRRSQNTTP